MVSISITSVIVFFIELTLYWFPWGLLIRNKLPRLAAYVLGVLGMMIPYSALLWYWGYRQACLGLWMVLTTSGVAVMGAWGLDAVLHRLVQASEMEEQYETRQATKQSSNESRSFGDSAVSVDEFIERR